MEMNVERFDHSATLLPNGTVLVAGGREPRHFREISSAEIYDPVTRSWSETAFPHNIRGDNHAILLPSGKVLVEGLGKSGDKWGKFAELYDPATGTWTVTGTPGGSDGQLTLLPNGMALVEGGIFILQPRKDAQLYDPASETWTATDDLHTGRGLHTATLLSNGDVLVTGGGGRNE
jgi:N-acetylneuraminic acid mutarotase